MLQCFRRIPNEGPMPGGPISGRPCEVPFGHPGLPDVAHLRPSELALGIREPGALRLRFMDSKYGLVIWALTCVFLVWVVL